MALMGLFGKGTDDPAEYKRFKKAMQRNPQDHGLQAQFIKFCLLNRFTNHESANEYIAEALERFKTIQTSGNFDLQCHYLVGKYYQEERDLREAYHVYLNALKRFNRTVDKNPELKAENVELAYSVALNLMALQSDPVDPEVERCFKIIRKSYPLHLKRVELDNEMAKPAPDKIRMLKLREEIKQLKAEEEGPASATTVQKTTLAATKTTNEASPKEPKKAMPPVPKLETKALFSKLFEELSPMAVGLNGTVPQDERLVRITKDNGDTIDFFKMIPEHSFLIYRGDNWEGPFTMAQLRSTSLEPSSWVCRVGSQQVIQAYEMPDLQPLFQN